MRGDVVAEGLPDRTGPPRRAAGESATRFCPCMDRRATLVAPARALAEPLFPARPERRSALMAPIPRPLADGDMSLFDLPLGDLRPWMADRRLSHGIAMACRPRSSFSVCRPLGSASCTGWAVRGARPPHLRLLWHAERSCRYASRLLLRAGTGGGMDGMRAQRQVALRGLTAPTHRRPRSSGRAGLPAQAPARLAADASARGTSLDDGRPPTTPASRKVAFCTLPPRGHAPSAAIEGDCGP